mgnify:CR=1 FL=1
MSNMAEISRLSEMTTQLPIEWYLNPEILEIEKRILFDQGPGYVGHEVMVPNIGDYYVPEWMNDAKVLVRNKHRMSHSPLDICFGWKIAWCTAFRT